MNKLLDNIHIKNIIVENIIEKCKFISKREVVRGKKKLEDRYYSIKDIEQVLNKLYGLK